MDIERFDCSSGGVAYCQGCYTMEKSELGDYVRFDDYESLKAENARLQSIIGDQDRILRSSVPEHHKGCASPVGAVQNYISELETEIERLQQVAEITNDTMRRMVEEANAQAENLREQLEIYGDKLASAEIVIQSFTDQKPAYKIDYQYGDDEEDPDLEYAGDLVFYALDGKDYERGTLFYTRPIPAQQSPAVAVPDRWQDKLELAHMKGQSFAGIDPSFSAAQECAIKMMAGLSFTSPRITEQDAREIVTSWVRHVDDHDETVAIPDFEWSHHEWKLILRALLNKLNGEKNGQ